MYTDDFVKNFVGKIVAIQRTEDNGDIFLLEFPSRRPIAQYIASQQVTITLPGRELVSKGNKLLLLVDLN